MVTLKEKEIVVFNPLYAKGGAQRRFIVVSMQNLDFILVLLFNYYSVFHTQL